MGPNQINKVRKNLTVDKRATRNAIKRLIGTNSENKVVYVNAAVDERANLIAKGVVDAAMKDGDQDEDDIDIAPKSKRRSAQNRTRIAEINESVKNSDMQADLPVYGANGTGTTLGKPGVLF
ncbi:hypothetical protein HK100_008115 [Physocladia obscura]|uniref:Uncharacterized protein n=1 Tax=Physocladia obscura TaxID=109957 RepID=A0AAD5TBX1_9FUNG|nr:hypothetical protein HK100_008115 [Physocladia obscura]